MRLAWCRGSGKAAGRLKLSKSGAVLVRGPVDACVGSPERLSYEGAAVIGDGLTTLPRVSQVIGGKGVLCANDLLEFAEQNAPAELFVDRVNDAKNEPEFCDRRAAVQATYRAEHINAAVTRGVPREKAEAAYDEALAAGTSTSGNWTFVPLTPEHVLYWPDGSSFTVADIQKDPAAFHSTRVLRSGGRDLVPVAQLRDNLHQRRAAGDLLTCAWRCLRLCRAARPGVRAVGGIVRANRRDARVRCGGQRAGCRRGRRPSRHGCRRARRPLGQVRPADCCRAACCRR